VQPLQVHQAQGISAVAFHPGNVATSFGSETTSPLMKLIVTNRIVRARLLITPEKGADQLVWFAESSPGTDWQPGEYYEKRKPAKTNPQASDAALAQALWERSEHLLGRGDPGP
jgi:hypothetical protein